VHTIESSSQDSFLLLFLKFPYSCEHSFLCAVLLSFFLAVAIYPLFTNPYILSSLSILYTAVILVLSNVLFLFCFLKDVT